MKWLDKIISRNQPSAPVKPVLMPTTEMRLADWRKVPTAVSTAKQLAENTTFKTMLAVLTNENPCHTVLALGVSPNDRIVMQARIEGYEMCLNNLQAFSKPPKPLESLSPTFENPIEEKRK